jgi:glycosidase
MPRSDDSRLLISWKLLLPLLTLLLIAMPTFAQPITPWWQSTSIYQIYPRSFQDSDGDGIGDLQGIMARLDYVQQLGFETIWLSPFYASPQADFGYDISDYRAIAPEYGTMADADALIAAVHARGMKIVFDMVLNHTSDQHPWFLESVKSRDNAKADWYIWRDGKGKNGMRPPNNWSSIPGPCGWQYAPQRKQWFFASFLPCQPDLNYYHPEVRAAMKDILRFWLTKGVDGFRLDIFNAIVKDDQFRDNPFSLHYIPTQDGMHARFQKRIHTVNHAGNFALAKEMRAVVDEFPGRFLVGEVFGEHPTIRQFLGEQQDGLNLIFLFDMLFYKYDADFFRARLMDYAQYYAVPRVPTFVVGNHDNKRSIGRVGGDLDKAKLLAVLQMTTRGVPVVYYGEEIGMLDAEIPKKDALDPLSHMYKRVPEWLRKRLPVPLNRDVCRTPMQWDASASAGFTSPTAKPWLPVSGESAQRNVALQIADTTSLMHVYSSLLKLRKAHRVFYDGDLQLIPTAALPQGVLGFTRDNGRERLTVLLNFAQRSCNIPLDSKYTRRFQVGEVAVAGPAATVQLGPNSGFIAFRELP